MRRSASLLTGEKAMRASWGVGAALMLACCATYPDGRSGETITYRYEPSSICLECVDYTIVLLPNGRGTLRWRKGGMSPWRARTFKASRREVTRYGALLARFRPRDGKSLPDRVTCDSYSTAGNTVDIRWDGGRRQPSHLRLAGGCDPFRNVATMLVLSTAPDLLRVDDLLAGR